MTFCLAVFRSRNETLYLANMLNSARIRASIVNSPKDAGISCGISVRFEEGFLNAVNRIIASKPFRSFAVMKKLFSLKLKHVFLMAN